MKREEALYDVKWYIPELTSEDISLYFEKYNNINPKDFVMTVVEEQREKNKILAEDFKDFIQADEDFPKIWNNKDKLLKLYPEYITNEKITSFLNNHSTTVDLGEMKGRGRRLLGGTSVRVPSKYFEKEDITYNPEGVYYKNYFIPLDQGVKWIEGFWQEYIETYARLHKDGSIFQVKLDFSKPVSLSNYRRISLDTGFHYGVSFSKENLFKKDYKSLFTRLIRDEGSKNIIEATEFLLDQKNGSLQIEELNEDNTDGWHINRYIHCEFDLESKTIKHFDGALMYYTEEQYNIRKGITLDKFPKLQTYKVKLFRIDGKIDCESRNLLMDAFFIGNPLILEYFDKEKYEKQVQEQGKLKDHMDRYNKQEEAVQERLKSRPHERSNHVGIFFPKKEAEYLKNTLGEGFKWED